MKIYLASPHTIVKFGESAMEIFMAGNTIFPKYIAPVIENATVPCGGRSMAEWGGTTR